MPLSVSKLVRGLAATLLAAAAVCATARPIDLAPAMSSFFSRSVNDSRSVVLRGDTNLDIASLGVYMDPGLPAFTLTAEVYAFDIVTGTRGALLSTGTQTFTDAGLDVYDIGVDATLNAGSFYELNVLGLGSSHKVQFHAFNRVLDRANSETYEAGPVTVFDGCRAASVSGCINSVLAHFRLLTRASPKASASAIARVPEPGSTALVAAALVALAAARRRRR